MVILRINTILEFKNILVSYFSHIWDQTQSPLCITQYEHSSFKYPSLCISLYQQ